MVRVSQTVHNKIFHGQHVIVLVQAALCTPSATAAATLPSAHQDLQCHSCHTLECLEPSLWLGSVVSPAEDCEGGAACCDLLKLLCTIH